MAWHKLTHADDGSIQYAADLRGIDEETWTALPIVDDRCPDPHLFEIVDEGGNVVVDLVAMKADVRAQVQALKDEKQFGLAPTTFGQVQNDDKSKQFMNGAVTMALIAKTAGQPFTIPWTIADNTVVPLTADQMISMGVQVGQFVTALQQHSTQLKNQVEAATTPEELLAIDINTGWPS